jgi:hypothetical protein
VSTNQTLDDAACKKGFNLDYAYAAWKPGDIGLKVLAGKMQNPFVMPAGSSLVWDSDLTPEGLAATWQMPGDAAMKPFATLSHHWVDERYAGGVDGVDATMLGLQLGVKSKVLTAGLGMFRFENMAGFAPIANGAEGNSLSGGNYATEFGEFEVFAEVRPDVGAPLVIGVDFVTNLEADALNTGYLVRVAYGKLKEPGSFTVAIDYRSLEADCVLGTWTDSDHFDGGTNGTGLGLSAAVQIDENASLAVTYLMDTKDPEGAATSYNRLQVDLSYKF